MKANINNVLESLVKHDKRYSSCPRAETNSIMEAGWRAQFPLDVGKSIDNIRLGSNYGIDFERSKSSIFECNTIDRMSEAKTFLTDEEDNCGLNRDADHTVLEFLKYPSFFPNNTTMQNVPLALPF